jgi:hypothetical protein
VDFTFEIYGDRLIQRKLLRVGDRVDDLSPPFTVMADQIRRFEVRLFDSQGASSGRRWEGLTKSTIDRKIAMGLDRRVLHATLRLRRSFTEGRGDHAGTDDQVVVITRSSLAFGSSLKYAARHQRPRSGTRRRPLDFNETQKRHLIKGLQRYTLTGALEHLA